MENMDGFADLKKPLIPSHSALESASVSIADNIYLTNMQKGRIDWVDAPVDNTKNAGGLKLIALVTL